MELNPTSIRQGKIKITQHDHMTGLSAAQDVDLSKAELDEETNSLLFSTHFNLLRNLQSKKQELQPKVAKRVEGVLNHFFNSNK